MNLDRERTTGARTRSSSGRRGTDDPSRGKAKRPRKHSGGRAKAAATDPSRPRLRIRVYPTARSTDARNNCFFEAVMRSIYYQVGPHHRYARRNPTPEDQAMLRNELADFVEASPGLLELWRIVDAGHADAEAALADRLRNLREEGNQVGEETLLAMALYTNLRFLVLQDTTGGRDERTPPNTAGCVATGTPIASSRGSRANWNGSISWYRSTCTTTTGRTEAVEGEGGIDRGTSSRWRSRTTEGDRTGSGSPWPSP